MFQQANCHLDIQAVITDPADTVDQVRNCDCIQFNTHKFQVDQEDQADQEALEDQRHIIQQEHQADQKDLAVLEDQVAQAAQADPVAQVVIEKLFLNSNHLQMYLASRMYRQANCHQEFPVDQAVRAALEDQVWQ
jgi:hypothetical protein